MLRKKPSFIVILTDDQGYEDISCYGSRLIHTPNLDRMAAEGMRFTDYYGQPICGPSRCSLMTGCYPLRVAERGNVKNLHPVLHERELTLAEILKTQNYATAMFGKWDLAGHCPRVTQGLHMDLLPHHRGFDTYFGTPASNDRWAVTALIENGEVLEDPIDLSNSSTKRYFEKAISFVEEHCEEPFFIYLAPNMPHVELHAGEEFVGSSHRGLYGDVIQELDHYTGELLDHLKELNLQDNTYVIFASDNGPWLGKGADGGSAHPLRAGKVSTWEGGPRVPCIMWAPERIPAGDVCSEIATSMDLFTTIVELAGASLPDDRIVDGESVQHLLDGRFDDADPDKAFFYYIYTHLQAVRRGRWKLILPRPENPEWLGQLAFMHHVAPWDNLEVPEPELYDLDADPSEARNIAGTHPDVVESLLELAETAREDIGDYNRIGSGARFFDEAPRRPDAYKWIKSRSEQSPAGEGIKGRVF